MKESGVFSGERKSGITTAVPASYVVQGVLH